MKTTLFVIQILFGVALISLILLQNSKGGLSNDAALGTYRSKRGAEKIIFAITIGTSIIFLIIAIMNVLINR